MKTLNKQATATFNKIIDGLNSEGYRKIDNTNGLFMALVIEKLYSYDIGTMYSFCHYFKQNGDLCQDPEMVFIKHKNGKVYPSMFQQAIPPVYEESIFFDNGWKCYPAIQADHTSFANTWLKNIKQQQNL